MSSIAGTIGNRVVNIASEIDQAPIRPFHIRILILCAFVAMLDGFDTQAIAFVAPVIAAQWSMPMTAFGAIFGAGLLGLTIGALAFGPLADRYGRKSVLILCVFLFGGFALATGWAGSFTTLVALRVLTGIGLGGAMPNIISMTSEFAPNRLRATAVTVMFCGFPLGSTLGGFLAARIIPEFGWQSVFILGGILPLLLVPVLVFALPESLRFLVARGATDGHIASILQKVTGSVMSGKGDVRYVLPEHRPAGFSGTQLFREGRAASTTLLWVAFFCNLLVMYFLVSWLPTLLKQWGYPLTTAIYATSTLNLGGVIGAIGLGWLIDRLGPYTVLGCSYALAGVLIGVIAVTGRDPTILFTGIFVVGIGIVGAQIGMNAVTAGLYPTALRVTGVGWALGFGRVGSILGPTAAGFLMAAGWGTGAILTASVAPAMVAAVAVLALGRQHRPVLVTSPIT